MTRTILALLCLAVAAACGPSESSGSGGETTTSTGAPTAGGEATWVTGTPTFVEGEGYMTLRYVSASADGPWDQSREVQLGEHELAPGQVHRVRLEERRRPDGIQDVGLTYLEVIEVLESRAGGPPVPVVPGESVAGIRLESFGGDGEDEWGPFHITRGPVASISFAFADVGSIRIGDQTFDTTSTVQDVVDGVGDCVQEHVRGGLRYRCAGADLGVGGPSGAIEALEISVHTPQPTSEGGSDDAAIAGAPLGSWSHHREQDHDGLQVWSTRDDLPPSRFRPAMTLRAGGVASVFVLHPADAHYMSRGTWTLHASTLTVTSQQTHGDRREVTTRYEIISREADTLTLRRLDAQ